MRLVVVSLRAGSVSVITGRPTYHFGHERWFHTHLLNRGPVDTAKPGLVVDVAHFAGGHAHPFRGLPFEQLEWVGSERRNGSGLAHEQELLLGAADSWRSLNEAGAASGEQVASDRALTDWRSVVSSFVRNIG